MKVFLQVYLLSEITSSVKLKHKHNYDSKPMHVCALTYDMIETGNIRIEANISQCWGATWLLNMVSFWPCCVWVCERKCIALYIGFNSSIYRQTAHERKLHDWKHITVCWDIVLHDKHVTVSTLPPRGQLKHCYYIYKPRSIYCMYSKSLKIIKCDIKWHYEWRCCVVDH